MSIDQHVNRYTATNPALRDVHFPLVIPAPYEVDFPNGRDGAYIQTPTPWNEPLPLGKRYTPSDIQSPFGYTIPAQFPGKGIEMPMYC